MGYWVEIHCDVRSERTVPGDYSGSPPCWSQAGNQPGAMGRRPEIAGWAVEGEARERGWVRKYVQIGDVKRLGWVCPHCQKFPPIESQES